MAENKLDSNLVSTLADLLHKNNLTEIEYDAGGIRIKVACKCDCTLTSVISRESNSVAEPPKPLSENKTEIPEKDKKDENIIKSPMVGMVYLSPEPSAKPYVSVGDDIVKGQTLFLIEAMKTFNPVKAPRSGKVLNIFVKDSELVEYGEPLLAFE